MSFGIDKCNKERDKTTRRSVNQIPVTKQYSELTDFYKYLQYQRIGLEHGKIKQPLTQKYEHKLTKKLKTELTKQGKSNEYTWNTNPHVLDGNNEVELGGTGSAEHIRPKRRRKRVYRHRKR